MRSTIEILADVEDNVDVEKEELKMALLVLNSINFFNHNNLKNLLRGGRIAEMTRRKFPGACAELGISQSEYDALKMDPFEYLGPEHIPGTDEWKKLHDIGVKILNKITKKEV